MSKRPEIELIVQNQRPTKEQLDELRAAMRPRTCGNCAQWVKPNPADRARDPRFGFCARLRDVDLSREPAPDDQEIAFIDGRGGELATRASYGCLLWSARKREAAAQSEGA